MRAVFPLVAASMALAGCSSDEQANNTVNVDQAVMANDLAANDVTAIDAVTGDAANMAADVDIEFTNDLIESTARNEGARGDAPKSRQRSTVARPEPATSADDAPAPEPATNETTE